MNTTFRPKRRAMTAVALLAGSALLAACSGGGGGGDASTVRVQVEASKLGGFEAVAEAYAEVNPDAEISYETITSDQKATTNGLTLASPDAPDLGLAPINATSYSQLLGGDALVPLDDVWAEADLQNRYSKATIDSLAPDGSTPYSVVPEQQLYNVVYYNTDLFAELGIAAPPGRQLQSDEELYALVEALRGAGKEGLCIGGTSNYQLGWLFDGQLATATEDDQLAGYLASGQPDAEEVDYTDPAVVEALAKVQAWYDNGVFQTGMLGQNYDTALANFVATTCGAVLGTATTVTALEENGASFGIDWFLLPGVDGPTVPATYTGSTLVVPKTAANPEGAKDFLAFLMTSEAQQAYVEGNGTLPAVDDVDAAALQELLPPLVNSVLSFVDENGASLGWTSVVPGEMGQASVDPALQRQLNGGADAEQTATDLQENYESFKANQ